MKRIRNLESAPNQAVETDMQRRGTFARFAGIGSAKAIERGDRYAITTILKSGKAQIKKR